MLPPEQHTASDACQPGRGWRHRGYPGCWGTDWCWGTTQRAERVLRSLQAPWGGCQWGLAPRLAQRGHQTWPRHPCIAVPPALPSSLLTSWDSLGTPTLVLSGIPGLGQARWGPLAPRRRRETTGRWGTDGQSMKLARAEPRHPRAARGLWHCHTAGPGRRGDRLGMGEVGTGTGKRTRMGMRMEIGRGKGPGMGTVLGMGIGMGVEMRTGITVRTGKGTEMGMRTGIGMRMGTGIGMRMGWGWR